MLVEHNWAHYSSLLLLVVSRPFSMSLITEFLPSKRKPSEERSSSRQGKEEEESSPQIEPKKVGHFKGIFLQIFQLSKSAWWTTFQICYEFKKEKLIKTSFPKDSLTNAVNSDHKTSQLQSHEELHTYGSLLLQLILKTTWWFSRRLLALLCMHACAKPEQCNYRRKFNRCRYSCGSKATFALEKSTLKVQMFENLDLWWFFFRKKRMEAVWRRCVGVNSDRQKPH